MKKLSKLVLVFVLSSLALLTYGQEKEAKIGTNYGNWASTTSDNIGINMNPNAGYGKINIYGTNVDFLQLHTEKGHWKLHSTIDQERLMFAFTDSKTTLWNILTMNTMGRIGIGFSPVGTENGMLNIKSGWGDWLQFHTHSGSFWAIHSNKDQDRVQIYLNDGYDNIIWNVLSFNNSGQVGIGTADYPEDSKFAVDGKIYAREIEVNLAEWSDFVFATNYKIMALCELEAFINKNKHLPGIPSEEEIIENGLNLGQMDAKLLEKIEELTLYVIELKKEIEVLKKEDNTSDINQN